MATMAAIVAPFSSSSLLYSSQTSCSFLQRPRFSFFCHSSSSSPPQHGGRTGFMDFPYVSAPHKALMVDLVSTVESRLGSLLNPCSLPPDVESYQNETGTAHAALHLRSGVQSSQIDFILGSWLHCELPSGGALNITSLSAYLNSSTDAPNLLVELIQSTPTSMVLILDLPHRKELVLNPDYLKTFYEDTQLDQHRQHLQNLSEATIIIFSPPWIDFSFSSSSGVIAALLSTSQSTAALRFYSPVTAHCTFSVSGISCCCCSAPAPAAVHYFTAALASPQQTTCCTSCSLAVAASQLGLRALFCLPLPAGSFLSVIFYLVCYLFLDFLGTHDIRIRKF